MPAPYRRFTVVAALSLLGGCHSDDVVSPVNTGASAFWALRLNHPAVTLALAAPYDALQLVATPVSASGAALEGLPAATFRSTNVNSVGVDAGGLITAVGLTPGALVIASVTAGGVTHADTATVAVTPDPAGLVVASFSLEPVPPDSARFSLGGSLLEPFHNLTPTVLDPNGAPIFGLPVRYASLDHRTATIDPWSGTVTGQRLGYVPLVGTMTAYGQTFVDTLQFRIGRPAYAKVNVHGPFYGFVPYVTGSFHPESVTVGVGAVVEWENTGMLEGTLMDMTFDSAQALTLGAAPEQYVCVNYGVDCDGTGNIAAFGPPKLLPDGSNADDYFRNVSRGRRFTAPGTFRYRNTQWNTEGVVVVVDESAP